MSTAESPNVKGLAPGRRTPRSDDQADGEREISGGGGTLSLLAQAELDQQITTAKAYPRSINRFVEECRAMATLNEQVAEECFYAIPRDGKSIEGPSARLAEIVASAWGNCRAGSRIIEEGEQFITAQGAFHDLERNVAITYEVRRRITDRKGRRFSADMIGVTGSAACSIALRNAVFRGVPKAFWSGIYEEARKVAIGDAKTLASKRKTALDYLQKFGATSDRIFSRLAIKGEEDITLEHLALLKGLATAIKDGETSVDEAFPAPQATAGVAPNPLGDIPLNPPESERHPKAKRQEKPQPQPTQEQKPEKPLHEQILALAAENEITLEALFAGASRIAGKQVGSTRDLEALPAEVLCVLLDELEGRGAK